MYMHISSKMDLKPTHTGKNVDTRVFLRNGRKMPICFLSLIVQNYQNSVHVCVINYWSIQIMTTDIYLTNW
jgi:hypothetical protein